MNHIVSSSNPLAAICDHPHCSKTYCQFSSQPPTLHGDNQEDRNGINMITFIQDKSKTEEDYTKTRLFNIHEEIIIQSVQ